MTLYWGRSVRDVHFSPPSRLQRLRDLPVKIVQIDEQNQEPEESILQQTWVSWTKIKADVMKRMVCPDEAMMYNAYVFAKGIADLCQVLPLIN